jgi:3-oxoacyl-[acyl-carrier-protein] synthase-1
VAGDVVYIGGLGASTAVGRDALSSAAAVRAGIAGFARHPFVIDTMGEPVQVAIAPWLDADLTGAERLEALLYPALDQALEPLQSAAPGVRVALALALPGARPGIPLDLQANLRDALQRRYMQPFAAIAAFPCGHAGGMLALDAAVRKISTGAFDACVVAGVDSYMEPETLEWLEECNQLHGAGLLNNAWGFVPGEAGAALLLIGARLIDATGVPALALVNGVGIGQEANRIKTETVCIGEGLTDAFQRAIRCLSDGQTISDIYCDMNGEPYRADEYGFACLRTKEYFEAASNFVAPASCWGDVAAASGPLCVELAAIAGFNGYANGRRALISVSSESGERAAAIVDATAEETQCR